MKACRKTGFAYSHIVNVLKIGGLALIESLETLVTMSREVFVAPW